MAKTGTMLGAAAGVSHGLPAGAAARWDFSDITQLWQDTGRTSAVVADTNLILGVTDKSGSGHHLAHTGGKVVYKTNIKNGHSIARFSFDVDSILSATMVIANGCTILVVAAFSAVAQQRRSLIGGGGNYFGADFSNTSKLGLFEGAADHASSSVLDTNFHLYTAIPNGATSKQRVDAAEVYSGDATTGTFTNPNLGDDGSGSNLLHVADIGEVVIYTSVLGAAVLANAEAFLKTKWAIA